MLIFRVTFGPHVFFHTLQLRVEQFLLANFWNLHQGSLQVEDSPLQSAEFGFFDSNSY
jgi:hypothetical protein